MTASHPSWGKCMTRSSWAAAAAFIVVTCGGAGLSSPAEAQASFDCRRASHPSEIAVCRDPELATVDRTLDSTFRAALERSENADNLRAEQRGWLRDLRLCGDDPYCLYETYADRIEVLKTGPGAGGLNPDVQNDPAEELSSDRVPDVVSTTEEEPSPAQGAAPIQQEIVPSAEARSEGPSAAPATAEAESQQRPARTDGDGGLVGGGLILGLIVAVLAALLATKALADHSMRKFGWPMILNWWNVLHLIVGFALWGGAMIGAPLGGIVVAGGLWLIVLAVNIRKTDVLTGLAMTVVQPFVVAILFVVFQFSRNKPKPYDYISRS